MSIHMSIYMSAYVSTHMSVHVSTHVSTLIIRAPQTITKFYTCITAVAVAAWGGCAWLRFWHVSSVGT